MTTFRNPLADPLGTRRRPPLVCGPQFENRWYRLLYWQSEDRWEGVKRVQMMDELRWEMRQQLSVDVAEFTHDRVAAAGATWRAHLMMRWHRTVCQLSAYNTTFNYQSHVTLCHCQLSAYNATRSTVNLTWHCVTVNTISRDDVTVNCQHTMQHVQLSISRDDVTVNCQHTIRHVQSWTSCDTINCQHTMRHVQLSISRDTVSMSTVSIQCDTFNHGPHATLSTVSIQCDKFNQ